MREMRVLWATFVFFLVGFGSIVLAVPAWAGDGVVALQSADPSCPDDSSNIYVGCSNGTVTDNRSGLIWLAHADCFGEVDWHDAMEIVAGLSDQDDSFCTEFSLTPTECDCGLSDGSSPGEWRLPSISEWRAMVNDALGEGGDPGCIADPLTITNDIGDACRGAIGSGSSFANVQTANYYSSNTFADNTAVAWVLNLSGGNAVGSNKASPPDDHMWPVRGGQ